jgi:DNA-binding MarR family transcriptional regulator
MTQPTPDRAEVDKFILEQLDTVPHLEALLLLWNSRPKSWALAEIEKSLYVSTEAAQAILQDLKQRGLITEDSDRYSYNSNFMQSSLIAEVDKAYRRELLRISRMIHSKAPSSVREFARAFKFTKD